MHLSWQNIEATIADLLKIQVASCHVGSLSDGKPSLLVYLHTCSGSVTWCYWWFQHESQATGIFGRIFKKWQPPSFFQATVLWTYCSNNNYCKFQHYMNSRRTRGRIQFKPSGPQIQPKEHHFDMIGPRYVCFHSWWYYISQQDLEFPHSWRVRLSASALEDGNHRADEEI